MRCWFCIILFFSAGPFFCGAQAAHEGPRTAVILSDHSPIDFKQAVGDLSEAPGIEVVRHNAPVIHFRYSSETDRINAVEMLYNRGYDLSMKNGFPVDFPILESPADRNKWYSYNQHKLEWIAANPERYTELKDQYGITHLSLSEFEELTLNEQQQIINNPELYTIE